MVKHPKIQPFFHVRGHLFWQFENKETNGVSLSCLLWWWRHRSFLKISQDPPFCSFFWKAEQKVIFFLLRFKTVGIHSVKFVWNKCSIMCYYRDFLFFCAAKSHKKIAKITNHTKMEFSQSREKSRQSWQIMHEIPPERRLFSLLLNFWRFGLYFNFISVPFWFGFMWCAFWSHVSFWFWFSTMSVLQIEKQWKFGRVGKNVAKRKSKLKLDIWP